MKKINYIIAFITMLFNYTYSQQNLVPNPSFESYTTCPDGVTQINYTGNWYSPTSGTPEFYDSCFTFSNPWTADVDVPANLAGYQNALGIGGAYSGLIAWYTYSQTYREYIQTKLTTTLTAAQRYYVSMYLSLADSSIYTTDDFGVYFSQTAINRNDFDAFTYTPQISNPQGQFLNDKINWMKISGSFIASGNEQYITIGNFKNDNNTDTIRLTPNLSQNSNNNSAYYYIDHVCISTDSLFTNTPVGIKEFEKNNGTIYYNEIDKKIIIKENGSYIFNVFDLFGNKIYESKLVGIQSLNVSEFANGYYTILINNNNQYLYKKIIIY